MFCKHPQIIGCSRKHLIKISKQIAAIKKHNASKTCFNELFFIAMFQIARGYQDDDADISTRPTE